MRVLIIHPGFLGDTVFLGPAVRALKAAWPTGHTTLVVTPRGAPAALLLPGVDEVVVYDKRGADRGPAGLWRLGARLKAAPADAALVSHLSTRSAVLARLSGAGRTVGYSPLLRERVALNRAGPYLERSLNLAIHLGAPAQGTHLRMNPPQGPSGVDSALKLLPRPRVGLVPGAEWESKRWGAPHFSELAARVAARGGSVVTLGGPAERELCHAVVGSAPGRALNTCGNTIPEAFSVITQLDALVGNDSGLTHAARALGVPTVVVFGPTSAARHHFTAADRPVHLSLPCQPCDRRAQHGCPLTHHDCMATLAVAPVAEALWACLPQVTA